MNNTPKRSTTLLKCQRSQYELLCVNNEIFSCLEWTRCFRKKPPNLPTQKIVIAEKKFFHHIDWWTLVLLVEWVCFSPFYFFWLICTFQAETHKSVSHSHVLTAKSLNARLYLLLCLSPLSYRNCPCFIKMLDMIDCSFLGFFYLPAKVHGHCWVEHSTILSSQAANRERRELGYEDASVPPDKAFSHPTSEHRLKWARFWLWLAQKG